jgi:hypothetical protein
MAAETSDTIRRMVLEAKENEITKDALVTSLREHGIKDINTYVEHLLEAVKSSQPVPLEKLHPQLAEKSQEDALVDLLFGDTAQKAAKNYSHTEPRLPFVVGGRHYKPNEIHRFNSKNIHFVWDSHLVASGLLRAVTDREEMRSFLAQSSVEAGGDRALRNHVSGAGHTFYQHINFGGASLSLSYRHALPDLTKVVMSGWWFWAVSWNDQISSLRTGSGFVTLGEHIMNPYLTGATMTIGGGQSIAWIGNAWNDRISAILG